MWKWLKRLFGRATLATECPHCHEVAVRWHGDNPIHPDGPPIFEWWECGKCGAQTEYAPSRLMDKAARDLGYQNAKEIFDKIEDQR